MPKPTEICEVRAKGGVYKAWKSVDVERSIDNQVMMDATLIVAEIGDFKSWSTLRLKPGDPVDITMAGQPAMNKGQIVVRQVVYDAANHNVRIVVASKLVDAIVSSAKPEQQKKVTLTQACNRILQPSGITFSLLGSPKNADKVFRSIITHFGETQFEAVARLCKMRNIHLMDDMSGNLVGIRHDGSERSIAELTEGKNILSAEMIWRYDYAANQMEAGAQEPGHDDKFADPVRNPSAKVTNPNLSGNRTVRFAAEHPGDSQDMQMRADHEMDLNIATMFDAQITVQGWLRNNGSLWLNETHKLIDVYSPMLFPANRETLGIYKVNCRQGDDIGTVTTLSLCLKNWLGHGSDPMQSGSDSPEGQAKSPPATAQSEN